MQIIELKGENFKRLKAVQLEPTQDGLVIVGGRNGQGKTSVLDLIFATLAGPKATKDIIKPIRDGESSAFGEVDLGDYIVTRSWEEGKAPKLTVKTKDGIGVKSPQSLLDELLGKWSFDPLTFLGQSDKEQRESLLGLVNVDLDALDGRRRSAFEERTIVNRSIKDISGELKGMGKLDRTAPAEPLSFKEARDQVNAAIEHNEGVAHAVTTLEAWIDEEARLEAALVKAREAVANSRAYVDSLPGPIDLGPLERQLEELESVNDRVRHNQRVTEVGQKLMNQQLRAADLTSQIEAVDQEKAAALAAAQFPIQGLGVDEVGVTMQGIPLKQASGAERLRVAIALAIAANPTIRVVRITDASLLDSQSMAAVAEMAEQHGVQIWLEVVDETGEVGFTIEDGTTVG